VHGVGGLTGMLLAGVLATTAVTGPPDGVRGLLEGNPQLLLAQIYGIVVTLVWVGVVTFLILKVVALFVPLRVRQEDEIMGLDVTQHGEAVQ
jgi:Amt family ammonium transporter